jgi:UDP-N-acetylmuramyl pentapeptide phosphotransferase/UDP-N-acetylglucosamine-1-phosphate transferase
LAACVLIAAFAAAAALCALLAPTFRRLFLAVPDARSSHIAATPQGGGLVIVPVALAAAAVALLATGGRPDAFAFGLAAAMLALMALGARDDRASLNPLLRLSVQAGAAALALAAAPVAVAAWLAILPPPLVWAGALIGMLWFINLTNFMDGVDLMSVAEFVPAFATACWLVAPLSGPTAWIGWLCLAMVGALLGFALSNRPPARLFLGDAGSLPLGVLGATAALVVCEAHGPVVALLPFLYYAADATLTLARRVVAGEKIWRAHRDHFYQRAQRNGLSTWQVIGRVATCNVLLCGDALLIAAAPPAAQAAGLALGAAAVALLLGNFAKARR